MPRAPHEDNIFRVNIASEGVDIMCLGLERVDSDVDGYYDCPDDLPDWVQERLAILMMMDATPPTTEVEGVGRRISASIFWVYGPEADAEEC